MTVERTPDFERLPDLASRALGGTVMFADDDFYADAHRLIAPGPARHDPELFGDRGKVYDGWETRRRRDLAERAGDAVVVRLGMPGVIRGVDIDTAHFTGNYPPFASVEAATVLGYPTLDEVLDAGWSTLIDHAALNGDSANVLPVEPAAERLVTHLRMTIHPDGGVARFRAFGEAVPDPRFLGGRVDLGALTAGGLVDSCSNMFYSSPANALSPGRALVMSDGWETARRRDDGNDWLTVRLAAPGELHEVVIDTSRFVGNAPGWASLTDVESGVELLPRTRLLPDTEHRLRLAPAPPARLVRLDIYPDGGISRLRLIGSVPDDARGALAERWLGLLPPDQAVAVDRTAFFA